MAELIHVSRVRIVKDRGPVRRHYIESFPEPVRYGVHGWQVLSACRQRKVKLALRGRSSA